MANTPSAGKRARQSERRRQHNASLRSRMRTRIKQVLKAVASGEREQAQAAYRQATSLIDSGVGKGLLHKGKANRQKSRLNAHVRDMA